MIFFKKNISLLLILLFVFTISSCTSSSDDEQETPKEKEKEEILQKEEKEEEVVEKELACPSGNLYNEKDGLVRVDIVNTSKTANGWRAETRFPGYEGDNYLVWTGADSFNEPGKGIITFSVKITNPGTYQFVWSSRITAGDSNTEHNDSWLRIKGDDFYGEKANVGIRVYPKGSGKTPNPEGSSKDGWLKIYMNRLREWFWRSSTNDNDPFNIFVKFDKEGVYDVEISGRSKSHAIDQFVLFKTDKSLTAAQNTPLSEITCK